MSVPGIPSMRGLAFTFAQHNVSKSLRRCRLVDSMITQTQDH